MSGQILDGLGVLLMVGGVLLTLIGAVGLLRLPDLLARTHGQSLVSGIGLLLVITGVAVSLRTAPMFGILALVCLFQLLTSPVGAHMIGRAARRARQYREDLRTRDDAKEP